MFINEHDEPIEPLDKRDSPGRRATDSSLEVIAHKVSRIAGEFTEFKGEVKAAIEEMRKEIRYNHAMHAEAIARANETAEAAHEAVKRAVKEAMSDAFPGGDPDGHRRHHEAVIRHAEQRAEFWQAMRKEIGKWGLISVLGFLAMAAWRAFLKGPG